MSQFTNFASAANCRISCIVHAARTLTGPSW
jgi:hypothetical protein